MLFIENNNRKKKYIMNKLKVYIMHSDKIDYINEIYRPLLNLKLMVKYYLILPLSDKYKSSYIKDLYIDSDVIICDLTKSNIFLNIEIKTAKKLNKPIYYFINVKDKNVKKYKDVILYEDKIDFANQVKVLLDNLNQKELLLKRNNIYCLGKINNVNS